MKKIFTFFALLFLPFIAMANPTLDVLSDGDASLYKQIFELQDKEKINSATKLQSQLQDDLLLNEVLYQRYFSDSYTTRGKEITAWMNKYNDMPGAVRMKKLANLKRRL